MNMRSRKTKGLSLRLLALLLCCACLFGVAPSAIATDVASAAEESVVEPTPSPESSEEPAEKSETDSLFEQLMACTTYEEMQELMDTLTDEQMDAFSEEQNAALIAKVEALGGYAEDAAIGGGSGGGGGQSSGNTFRVEATKLENVEVAYYAYNSKTQSTSASFTVVSSGSTVSIENFNSKSSNGYGGYILFFVKPNDNYLLTTGTASGNGDIYNIESLINGGTSNISAYPNLSSILTAAKEAGYVGVFGYYRGAGVNTSGTMNFSLTAVQPKIKVTAVSDKTSGVKPGDVLTFTIEITPETPENTTVETVKITSLTINNTTVEFSNPTKNSSGNWETTVKYTATQQDCENGSVNLKVDAEVGYNGALAVKQTGHEIKSDAVITGSATTTCLIAPKNSVEYLLQYKTSVEDGTVPETKPEGIQGKPATVTGKYSGQTVTVDTTYGTSNVDDPDNKGVWTFGGWYNGDTKVGNTITMGDSLIVLTGTWTFTPYPTITITKTLSGNMYDANATFPFTVSYKTTADDEEKTESFGLGKDGTKTISIPAGATVTVTEDTKGYTYSLTSITDASEKTVESTATTCTDGNSNGLTFTMPSSNVSIKINNEKQVDIDTGVILDKIPYILILAFVLVGLVAITRRRRSRADD